MTKIIAIIMSTSILIFSCATNEPSKEDTAAEETYSTLHKVSKEQFNINNMKLITPSEVPFSSSIKTTGKVDVLPENTTSISTYYSGYVKNMSLIEGEYVKKGQRLFTLNSPAYIEIQQGFLEAKAQLEYLKNEYERQKVLAKENVASQKNYLKAKSEYGIIITRYESLKQKLILMKISPASLSRNNLRSSISIYAPISGYVSSIAVHQGKLLSPEEVALEITNMDHLHAQLMVFEQDIMKVKKGQDINYSFSGSSIKGKVITVGKSVIQNKSALSVHGSLFHDGALKNIYPGMFVKAEIITQSKLEMGIPENCVVELDGKNYILLLKSEKEEQYTFTQEEVKIINQSNGYVQVEGLAPGMTILNNGAFDLIGD